jgi:hypothetical protein
LSEVRLYAATRPNTLAAVGAVPTIAFTASLGLFLIAGSYTAGRFSLPIATIVYWVGVASIILPAAFHLTRSSSRRDDILVLSLVGLALYGAKVVQAPGAFTLFDEFQHWATLNNIVSSHHLFGPNNILLASPYYPGLEIITSALVSSGISVWLAATMVIGVARLLLVFSLFLFLERAAESSRVAAFATFFYMANPSFLIFDAQFAYESLALPLALFALFCVIRRVDGPRRDAAAITIAFLFGVIGTVVTHHITSIALAAFLICWAATGYIVRRFTRRSTEWRPGLFGPAMVAIAATVGWILFVATVTVGYLAPAFQGALLQVLSLILGAEGSRELFRAATGELSPTWELLVGFGTVGLILVCLPFGLAILWRTNRQNYNGLALGLVALAYSATLIPRFTARGAELSARTVAFTFVGIGFILALVVIEGMRSKRPFSARFGRRLVLAGVALVFVGGIIVGIPPWARLPGPYRVAADARSVEPLGITTARWTLANLGPGNRFMSDRTNRLLLATYGRQHPISTVGDHVDLKDAYFATQFGESELHALSVAEVSFVIADMRLPTALPTVGVYVDRGEVIGGPGWTQPMPRAALEKWDLIPGVGRIYDAGSIRIYDVRSVVNAAP